MNTKWCYLHGTHTQLLLYCARWSAYRDLKAKRKKRNEEKATKEDRKTGTKEMKQDTKRYKTKEADGLRTFLVSTVIWRLESLLEIQVSNISQYAGHLDTRFLRFP